MLIKALNEYYDILARNDKVCKDGFSRQNITHMIMLRKDGTISDIINVEQESEPDSKGKTKLQPISVVLPRLKTASAPWRAPHRGKARTRRAQNGHTQGPYASRRCGGSCRFAHLPPLGSADAPFQIPNQLNEYRRGPSRLVQRSLRAWYARSQAGYRFPK